jgi:hypothetical protein
VPFILVALFSVAKHTDRFPANASSAVGSLRTLHSANIAYAMVHPQQGYPNKLADLALELQKGHEEPMWAIDQALASGGRTGYSFAYTPHCSKGDGKIDVYEVSADPIDNREKRHFFMNETGVIRVSETGRATVNRLALR